MSMTLDTSEFLKNTDKLLHNLPDMGNRILLKLGDKVVRDANNIEPKTPHLEGQLRSVVTVGVIGPFIVQIWFQMPYSAKWHEATDPEPNWSETGVGPKYVESKLIRFKSEYGQFLAFLFIQEMKNV